MIKGGYYITARQIRTSEIADAPPYVREIFDWLVMEANYQDDERKHIDRGSLVRSYDDILDGLSWHVGWRKESYSRSQCENAMKWLKKHAMITTKKTTKGMYITVCNYDLYQNPANYESHTESHVESHTTATPLTTQCHTIKNKEKNIKNENNEENILLRESNLIVNEPVEDDGLISILEAWAEKLSLPSYMSVNGKDRDSWMKALSVHGKEFCMTAISNSNSVWAGSTIFDAESELQKVIKTEKEESEWNKIDPEMKKYY